MKAAFYPLSPLQQGLLFHGVLDPGAEGQYTCQVVCDLEGPVDRRAFESAWRGLLARHAVLRTAFVWEGVDEALQVVLPEVELPLTWHDLEGEPEAAAARSFDELAAADRRRGFEFRRPPLMRLAAVRLGERRHRLLWSFHHLVMDGWSEALLVEEFAELYRAALTGAAPVLSPVRPYGAFVQWARGRDLGAAERYWRRALAGITGPSPLPGGARRAGGARRVETQGHRLTTEESAVLRALARRLRLSLNTLVEGAWALALARFCGCRDLVFGVAVAGRPPELAGVEGIVGPFINTLPARVRLPAGARLPEWLEELQREGAEMRRFEYSPLVEVQGWSAVPRGTPLFETLYVFQSGPAARAAAAAGAAAVAGGLVLRRMDLRGGATNFPLTLEVEPGERIHLMVNADRGRLGEEASGGLLAGLAALLRQLPRTPDAELGAFDERLAAVERERREATREQLESFSRAGLLRARRRTAAADPNQPEEIEHGA